LADHKNEDAGAADGLTSTRTFIRKAGSFNHAIHAS
jgi:hypothetical protein